MIVDGGTIRVFIAIALPDRVRIELERIEAELKKERLSFRWVRPENIHLTLTFLGEVDESYLQAVAAAMRNAVCDYQLLKLVVKGLGVFPTIKRPRILWAGIAEDTGCLRELKSTLDQVLESVPGLGFKPERRKFKAHLTLGRAKGRVDGRQLAAAMLRVQSQLSVGFTVNEIHLFRSVLKPDGPIYTRLHSVGLKSIDSNDFGNNKIE